MPQSEMKLLCSPVEAPLPSEDFWKSPASVELPRFWQISSDRTSQSLGALKLPWLRQSFVGGWLQVDFTRGLASCTPLREPAIELYTLRKTLNSNYGNGADMGQVSLLQSHEAILIFHQIGTFIATIVYFTFPFNIYNIQTYHIKYYLLLLSYFFIDDIYF